MIRVENLSKFYAAKRALGPVSFEIGEGETAGFLGLNGAGKTTALRILACDLRPTSGTVKIGDVDAIANPHEVRKRIGFLPESAPLYTDMTVSRYLTYAGRLRGMAADQLTTRVPEVMELTDLRGHEHEFIGSLSYGYRQRVGVAQAIVHKPQFVILDEPTRGLDPVQIVEMRNLVHELKENHTVLISSHILTEISQTCDRLLVLGQGEILAQGDQTQLSSHLDTTKQLAGELSFVVAVSREADADGVTATIEGVEGVAKVIPRRSAEDTAFEVVCGDDLRPKVARAIIEGGHDILRLETPQRAEQNNLEAIFLDLVKGGGNASN